MTHEEAVCAHNKSLVAFLQRCAQHGVKLAVEKLQLCLEEVPLIGHYARLQRLLLQLQRYNLDIKYKKGPLMYITDTLSRTYLNETVSCMEVKSLELVDHLETLRVSPSQIPRSSL